MTGPSAEELCQALGGRREGRGWRAKCPAHADHDPSLSIDIGETGKLLVTCRSGCDQHAVIDALKLRGLWPVNGERTPDNPHLRRNGKVNGAAHKPEISQSAAAVCHPTLGEPNQRFEYFDAAGDPIGIICRWDTPKGKEIRPARLISGRWQWEGFPKPHPLYRLPDLVAQPQRPVLVVEGEKAADAARHLICDMTATTWPHGAEAVAKADWTVLRGRDVVLWPDADEPGAKAMRDVGAALRTAGARSVRLVKLPDNLPKGWDLADAIPNGLDPVDQIARARDIAAERLAGLNIISAADLLSREFRPLRWAVPDLVPEGLAILAGKPKAGKSWMALDFALAVAGGAFALGNIACQPGDVLYLALEDTQRRLHDRIRAVLQNASAPAALQIVTEWKRADDGGLDDLRAWLAMHRAARLVVIDTLQKLRGDRKRDASVYADDYQAVGNFKKLADEFTVPIVLIHHQNKEGNSDPLMSVSGTNGITGSADTILVLDREPNDSNGILHVKGRDVHEAEIAAQFDNETCKWLKLGKANDWRISEQRREIIRVLVDCDAMTPKEIAEAMGKNRGTVRFLLSQMLKDGDIKQRHDGKYTI